MSFILEASTSVWTLVPFMVLLGVGLGFNFQPVILAVQNAVRPNEMGVATSSVTFFRQMGGTIGVAAFLSILFTRLPTDIASAAKAAIAANPSVAPQFAGLKGANLTSDTAAFLGTQPAAVVNAFKVGFSNSIDLVFLVAALVVAIGFFVLIFLPQVALRNESGIQAQQSGAGEITGTAVTPDIPADQSAQAVGASAPTSTPPPSGTAEDPRH
jgi:hypothetical protein